MISTRFILGFIMVLLMWFEVIFMGQNDYVSFGLILITTFIMYQVMVEIQMGHKRTLRVHTKPNSWLYKIFSTDKTYLVRFVSFFMSFNLSFFLTLILRSLTRDYGTFLVLFIVGLASIIVFTFINQDQVKSSIVNDNLHDDISNHINNFSYIFLMAFILDFIFSFIISYFETTTFINSSLTVYNFVDLASTQAFKQAEYNATSMFFLNLFLLIDYFKQAVSLQILDFIIEGTDRSKYFLYFFVIIFILNILKLFLFSFSFVLLQKGFEKLAEKLSMKY